VDLSSIIAGSRVGQATAGGRKGVARLLSADKDVRAAKRGGAVERWANAAVLYLSVGAPGKKTGAGEFWEEGEGGDLFMRPDEAALQGAEAAIKRTPLEACLSTKRGEGGCGEEDPEAEEACDVGDDDDDLRAGGAALHASAARELRVLRAPGERAGREGRGPAGGRRRTARGEHVPPARGVPAARSAAASVKARSR
jgi:hypothetical protein